jgi:hypothetical protein
MRNLIRHILKEETESEVRKVIKVLKNFIMEYFSEVDWFKDVDFKIGEWFSAMSSKPIPEIIITIYIIDEEVREIDFSDLINEIDFIMDMFFPMTKDGRHTAVWVMDVNPV